VWEIIFLIFLSIYLFFFDYLINLFFNGSISLQVEEAFSVPIRDLCDGGRMRFGSTQFWTGPGYTLPVYLGGPYRIWGLSAVIMHQTLHLIAPGLYTYKINHVA
jgi:hypothetical protein